MLYLPETLAAALAPADPDASEEAVAWFRNRVPVDRATWAGLDAGARRRAWTLAGTTSLEVLAGVWRRLDAAIAQGTNFGTFRRAAREHLEQTWAGEDSPGAHVVFRNAVQTAYSAGRWAQSTDPDVLAGRPWWRFEAILDPRTTEICRPLDRVTLRAEDPWWASHYPPLHHQCRSGVVTLSAEQAAALGGARAPDGHEHAPQSGWGGTPNLGEWSPDTSDAPAPLREAFEAWRAREA